jgi:cysteine synthase A
MNPDKQTASAPPCCVSSVLDCIGNTPMMEMNVPFNNQNWHFFAKLEFMNPSGSVKDRIAKYIIEKAERSGQLKADSIIAEATSGNTGIGLSMVCAAKKYKLVICMPEHMSLERRKIMLNLGAEICLTPMNVGFAGSQDKTVIMAKRNPRVFLTRQFQNKDNTECHYTTTGREILEQVDGQPIDAFIAGVGTGGTIMGVGKRLREANPKCKVIAVEPAESAVITTGSGFAPHKIQGIGDGFIPELLDVKQLDWTEVIKSDDAVCMAQELGHRFGVMVGVSSGANVLAAINVLRKIGPDKTVVTVLPDRSERYFSTDLYECETKGVIRQCSKGCEDPFC